VTHNEDMANLRMALLWCCATIVLLLLSQAIYPWVGIWETRNSPPVYSRLIPLEELCARDGPYRLMHPQFERDCEIREKWKSRSGQ
jgi:hypothetical protein